MCGVIGVIGSPDAAKESFLGMISQQHRGQDAAGILSYDKRFHEVKNLGLVENVFSKDSIEGLTGSLAIGHTRYSTVGKGDVQDVQPFSLNYPFGLGLVHNGNIVNYPQIKERLQVEMKRLCFTSSDSETILNWLAHSLSQIGNEPPQFHHLKDAVAEVFKSIHGSFSVVGILAEGGLFAFRDPAGIRPLMLGKKTTTRADATVGTAYMVASESLALRVCGYEIVRDVEPGELIYIEQKTQRFYSAKLESRTHRPCMFEWVYFASAESELEGIPVYGSRLSLGFALAELVRKKIEKAEIEVDLVAPVPDTSRTAASALAENLGLPYREVLIKNRYIKRTFILGSQSQRERSVDLKLNPVVSEIRGKSILLVDDSIVRGTTSKKIIELIKRAGAKKVYLVSTCPPIRFPCFYGIDFPDQRELIATGKTESEIANVLGANGVVYLDQEGLINSLKQRGSSGIDPCMACISGSYPTDVSQSWRFAQLRISERGGRS